MDYNALLNDFVTNLPKDLWQKLKGEYSVAIDLVKGSNVTTEIPVIVVYKTTEENYIPFVKEIFEAFTEFNTDFGGDIEKYSVYLAKLVKKREQFCNAPS